MPARPPRDPPTIAPTFVSESSSSLSGASAAPVELCASVAPVLVESVFEVLLLDVVGDDDESLAVSLELVDEDVAEDVEDAEDEVVDVDDAEDAVSVDRGRVPIVVGSESVVAGAVRSTETSSRLKLSRSVRVTATVLAKAEVDPHPYWMKPPSNSFL